MPTEFKDVEREEMEGIVGVNVCGVLRVTKDVLPFMLNDKSSSLYQVSGLMVGRRRD